MKWIINFFQTSRGDYPVKTFIEEQDKNTYARIIHSLELLEIYGPYLKLPYIKKLQGKLYELRISGKIAIRIFYVLHKNEYYLLHVFKKKGQKTPVRELKTGLDRLSTII